MPAWRESRHRTLQSHLRVIDPVFAMRLTDRWWKAGINLGIWAVVAFLSANAA